ncbi:hypothetical protein HZY86_02545 [Aerococcaceae bacterium DSM 111020]|nr:hypothetical protein [Aerococcaceae bacterium DSM 111020]
MLPEVRSKVYLRVIEQYPNQPADYYQTLLNLPDTHRFQEALLALDEEGAIINNDDIFTISEQGVNDLEDLEDNLLLLLRTIQSEGIGNGHQKLLPYLTDKSYGQLFNEAVTREFISAKNKQEIITPTPLGMMVSPSTFVTESGEQFIQTSINN